MKKSKFAEEQIAFALKQAESVTRIEEVCRKMGTSQASSTAGGSSSTTTGARTRR